MNLKELKRKLVRGVAKRITRYSLETEEVPCPLCGKREGFEVLYTADRYALPLSTVRCACGMVFENPMPTKRFLSKFYSSRLFRALDWGILKVNNKVVREFGAMERAYKHISLMKAFLREEREGKVSILDIGASEGTFLKVFKEHFPSIDRYAIEPGSNFSYLLDDGVRMVWPDIESVPKDFKFDIITLWHVLEHVSKPKEFIREIVSHLKENGHLLIEVPDFDRYDGNLRPIHIDHVIHLSAHTLKELLEKAGMKVAYSTQENDKLSDHLYGIAVVATR